MSSSSVLRHARYKLPEKWREGVEPPKAPLSENWFARQLERTLNLKYSLSIVVVGKRPGIGKTFLVCRLAELLDPYGFTPKDVDEGHYCFYAKNYMSSIQKCLPFRWFIFDEPGRKGSGGSKSEWQTEVNKALSSTAQISRFMLPVSVFIVPHRLFLATALLGLAQLMIVVNNRGIARVYHVEVSEFDGNIYLPYLGKIRTDQMPSQDLIDAVEAKKAEMWNIDTTRWIKDIEKADSSQKSSYDIADEIHKTGKLVEVLDANKRISTNKIGLFAKCGRTKAQEIAGYLRLYQTDKESACVREPPV